MPGFHESLPRHGRSRRRTQGNAALRILIRHLVLAAPLLALVVAVCAQIGICTQQGLAELPDADYGKRLAQARATVLRLVKGVISAT